MSSPQESAQEQHQAQLVGSKSNSYFSPAWKSSLTAGTIGGSYGLFYGAFFGILQSKTGIPSRAFWRGVQGFGGGTLYWASKSTLMEAWGNDPGKKTLASGISGALAGAVFIPITGWYRNRGVGALRWGFYGLVGQYLFNIFDESHTSNLHAEAERTGPPPNILQRITRSKWSPMQELTNEKYEEILKERMLRLDAEIAIIEEDVKKLRLEKVSKTQVYDR